MAPQLSLAPSAAAVAPAASSAESAAALRDPSHLRGLAGLQQPKTTDHPSLLDGLADLALDLAAYAGLLAALNAPQAMREVLDERAAKGLSC